jgi:uncharacterized protein HemY
VAAVIVAALGLVACGGSGSSTSAKQEHLNELAEAAPEEMQAVDLSLALVAIQSGDEAGARADLAKACPGTSPDDALEHLKEVAKNVQGSEEVGHLSAKLQREYIENELARNVC